MEQWNGTVWTVIPSPNASPAHDDALLQRVMPRRIFLYGCWYFGNGVNNQSLVEQWNGTVWTIVASPPNGSGVSDFLRGVSCASTSMCAAVGRTNSAAPSVNLAMRWNGVAWSKDAVPNANASFGNVLIGVSCFGPTSCVAGGWVNTIDSSGTTFVSQVVNWNGTTWALGTVPNPPSTTPGDQINALACVPGALCVGVGYGNTPSVSLGSLALSAPIIRPGYYEVASDGGIFTFGGAGFFGSTGSLSLNKPIVGMAVTPDGGGYWLVASDGGIFAFGDAAFFGSTGALVLNKPIVGMASTPDGNGYWLVATDGGIFAFGDAAFFGSTGALVLNKPIVGMATTPDGRGYWLVATDGGIFAFGDAGFFGSTGALVLNKPIVGMAATPDGRGYWLVATDGGIFAFGDAGFFGSTGALVLNKPIVGMAATADGRGYWLVASDGGIFTFGDAVFAGSEGGNILNKPVVGMGA